MIGWDPPALPELSDLFKAYWFKCKSHLKITSTGISRLVIGRTTVCHSLAKLTIKLLSHPLNHFFFAFYFFFILVWIISRIISQNSLLKKNLFAICSIFVFYKFDIFHFKVYFLISYFFRVAKFSHIFIENMF